MIVWRTYMKIENPVIFINKKRIDPPEQKSRSGLFGIGFVRTP
jgi:hypothetical protein